MSMRESGAKYKYGLSRLRARALNDPQRDITVAITQALGLDTKMPAHVRHSHRNECRTPGRIEII